MSHLTPTAFVARLVEHALSGIMVAAGIMYAIVKLNLFQIATLALNSDGGVLALVVLFLGLASTFASFAIATAVFVSADDTDHHA